MQSAKPNKAIRTTLQAEGAIWAAICMLAYAQTGAGWLMFALLLLVPDIAMLGYLAGNRIGALCYNFAHSIVVPATLAALGYIAGTDITLPIALIWGAHIGLDRAIGYGLKYGHAFKATHLDRV